MKRPGMPRRSTAMKRSAMKRWRKPKRTTREAELSRLWRDAVIRSSDLGCAIAASELETGLVSPMQAHHVIPQQVLRRRARELGIAEETIVWDRRVGMPVSKRRHERHHSRHEPIDRRYLSGPLHEFAREFGLEPWLDRHYPA